MKFKVILFMVVLAMFSSKVFAGETYFGIGIGQSSSQKLYEDDVMTLETGFNGGEDLESFSQYNTDMAFKLFAGYDWSDYIGLEFGYADFGEHGFKIEDTTPTHDRNITHSNYNDYNAELTGLYLSFIPKIKFSNGMSASLRLGVMAWDIDATLYHEEHDTWTHMEANDYSGTRSLSDNGVDLLVGVGISYWRLSLIYEQLKIENDDTELIMLNIRLYSI